MEDLGGGGGQRAWERAEERAEGLGEGGGLGRGWRAWERVEGLGDGGGKRREEEGGTYNSHHG